jgi:hypothetical protein
MERRHALGLADATCVLCDRGDLAKAICGICHFGIPQARGIV